MDEVTITKGGLVYVIERILRNHRMDCMLTNEQGSWQLTESATGEYSLCIGRRRTWQRALHDALTAIDHELERRAAGMVGGDMYVLHGRLFAIVAEFVDSEEGGDAANAFMKANPGTGLLAVADGRVIIAKMADKGRAL
jgi:hypothetical protein